MNLLYLVNKHCSNIFFSKIQIKRLFLRRRAKFREDRTIRARVISHFQFSKWQPPAISDLVLHHSGPPMTCA